MRKHNGMRPLDIVVLLKIIVLEKSDWLAKNLAQDLLISASEVSESLNRSVYAGLLAEDKKTVLKKSLLEFLQYGLKYVFPQQPGTVLRGIPTAHSAPILANLIVSNEKYVWADAEGNSRGQSIEPLYPTVPQACKKDAKLYDLLVLMEVLRVGKTRERSLAFELIKQKMYPENESSNQY